MGKINYKMLGVVTLYNPDVESVIKSISKYAAVLDRLVIWDNSLPEKKTREKIEPELRKVCSDMYWHSDGRNTFIAAAINYAWNMAKEENYDLVLTMDQDSSWDNFSDYRHRIECMMSHGTVEVYTPYIMGCDKWKMTENVQYRKLYINSGTVYPTKILTDIGGADERFPLDALDHDLAIRVQEKGYKIVCITNCILHHKMGTPTKSKFFPLKANNYPAWRTYMITYSQVLNYRKHRKWFTSSEIFRVIKDFIVMRMLGIVLLENDKKAKIKMLCKGITDGFKAKL